MNEYKPKKTILLLEDEEAILSTISDFLYGLNYNVLKFTNTAEALKALETITPDAIIADLKLPDIDGLEFLKIIRGTEQTRKLPFIFVSANNSAEIIDKAKSQGATEYITKPFDIDYLLARIQQLTK